MNMKRILIVDDDSSVGTMLKFVIAREQLGEVVATVTDEEQAVDEILFYHPDIVLIDLLFPHTDGIRIMKRAMSRGAGGHFIMISQAHDKNMEEMAYKEGIRFLYKGIIIKHNKTEPTYTKTSLFLCEKRRFFMARTEKGVVTTI